MKNDPFGRASSVEYFEGSMHLECQDVKRVPNSLLAPELNDKCADDPQFSRLSNLCVQE